MMKLLNVILLFALVGCTFPDVTYNDDQCQGKSDGTVCNFTADAGLADGVCHNEDCEPSCHN
jgi:hypothetical protein